MAKLDRQLNKLEDDIYANKGTRGNRKGRAAGVRSRELRREGNEQKLVTNTSVDSCA